jgi:hypothetical protein
MEKNVPNYQPVIVIVPHSVGKWTMIAIYDDLP